MTSRRWLQGRKQLHRDTVYVRAEESAPLAKPAQIFNMFCSKFFRCDGEESSLCSFGFVSVRQEQFSKTDGLGCTY